jgi:hypothetical protein
VSARIVEVASDDWSLVLQADGRQVAVFAVDGEMTDLARNLKATVPPSAATRDRGLIETPAGRFRRSRPAAA